MIDRIPSAPPKILPVHEGTERPIWSVMVPVYNCIEFIQEALESILMQDKSAEFMQIEVIDDCSSDGDVEALVNAVGKGRVQYYRQAVNRGSLRNFETCINRAAGHYIHLLHGDDRIEFGFYEKMEEVLTSNPEAGAAFSNFNYIDHNSNRVDINNKKIQETAGIIPDFLFKIAHRQLVQPPAIVVKRSVYEDLGSFFAVHFGEDWEMWTRIASKYPVAYVPEYLASYRVAHGIGISHSFFLTGQNVADMTKVINITQEYLPEQKRQFYKKEASKYYALFCIRIANSLLLHNKEAALKQIQGSWELNKSIKTTLWIIRFYLMDFFKYKQIEKKVKMAKKVSHEKNILSF
jgi:glycosyltransferase involved in cell wall biosynthesis